jgi:hypothetical protein
MKAYLSEVFSEEDGPDASEGKTIYILGSKQHLMELANFLNEVSEYLEANDLCHMHFRDYEKNWNKAQYIDVAISLEENS